MLKNKIIGSIVVTCLIVGQYMLPKVSMVDFEVRELDVRNVQEVEKVCKFFEDKEILAITECTSERFQCYVQELCLFENDDADLKISVCKSKAHGDICGVAIYWLDQQRAECMLVAVDQQHSLAAGLCLMNYLQKKCAQQNIKMMPISLNSANKSAVKFYHSLGFRASVLEKMTNVFAGVPAVRMYKTW